MDELLTPVLGPVGIQGEFPEPHRVGSIAAVLRDGMIVGSHPLPSKPPESTVAPTIGGARS